jgi:hypothetical protein
MSGTNKPGKEKRRLDRHAKANKTDTEADNQMEEAPFICLFAGAERRFTQ